MNRNVDLLIIGSGPAGLAAGIAACTARPGLSVVLLEKGARPGGKIPLSGSGQCNVTHSGDPHDFISRYGGKDRFVAPSLLEFPNSNLMNYLRSRGVPLVQREDGKIFPRSGRAVDILDAFVKDYKSRGGILLCGQGVTNLLLMENKGAESLSHLFKVEMGEGLSWYARAVVIATGGLSFPGVGTTGDALNWAKKLGLSIVIPQPALTPVYVKGWRFVDCSGISIFSRNIRLVRAGQKKSRILSGDVLWTHRGLSGPAILDGSRYMQKGDELKIALVPFDTAEQFESFLLSESQTHSTRGIKTILSGLGIPERLILGIFKECLLSEELRGADMTKEERRKVVHGFFDFTCRIDSLGGWDRAMATAGGIALSEIDRLTMAVRRVPHLYCAGEVLDVDGDTGGFNIQFAYSSGSLAGRSVKW